MAQAVISDRNLTPLIQIIACFMLAAVIVGVLVRATSKICITRRLGWDDALIFLALVGLRIGKRLTAERSQAGS